MAAQTLQDEAEIAEADGTAVFVLQLASAVVRQEIAAVDVLDLELRVHVDVWKKILGRRLIDSG